MKLIIDAGNTLVKYALFENDGIKHLFTTDIFDIKIVDSIRITHPEVQSAFLSSVRKKDGHFEEYLKKHFDLQEFNSKTALPIVINYKTPETLGKDRLAIAVAAFNRYRGDNILAIGAGSCITYDVVSKGGEYLGGAISPGLQMRFKALNTFTGNLPLIDTDYSGQPKLVGVTTRESILSGVINAVVAEVDGMIDMYGKQFPDIKIVLTGGDYKYFDKYLKNNIFAAPNLVLEGLKIIFDFNENK